MFTATRVQVITYLLGVCPFSIAFLVFLNSSVSFVITDLIGQRDGVGDASGSLGFADELLAIVACPVWGLISDRFGVRTVCVCGYLIIGLALFLFVQATNVYPQLLLGRLLFSLGAAAASTMVTAVLPTIATTGSNPPTTAAPGIPINPATTRRGNGHAANPSVSSELTITPERYQSSSPERNNVPGIIPPEKDSYASTSRIAGLAGMFTGCGALLALLLFLPLPARFQRGGMNAGDALKDSYYIVGAIAFILAVWCFFGLRGLSSVVDLQVDSADRASTFSSRLKQNLLAVAKSLQSALMAGFQRSDIALGYIGGFVARASSVGISLFIPLLVNATFKSSGLCGVATNDDPTGLPDIKRSCPRAYVVAAELTGVAELMALIAAPIFGYVASKIDRRGVPLAVASVAGVIGYPLFATQFTPDDKDKTRQGVAFLAVCLIGISQIGAIVCSLGTLSSGVLAQTGDKMEQHGAPTDSRPLNDGEGLPLLSSSRAKINIPNSLSAVKGSVAGVYSFYGGVGILILTKLGGYLFDATSKGSPFYIMAAFNGVLLLASVALGFKRPKPDGRRDRHASMG